MPTNLLDDSLTPCPFCTGRLVSDGTMPDGTELFITNRVGCIACRRHMPREFMIEMAREQYRCVLPLARVATAGYTERASGETADAGGSAMASGLVTEKIGRRLWRATLGDLNASHATKGRAVEMVLSMAAEVLTGDYVPFSIDYGSDSTVVYREPGAGWCYTIEGARVSMGGIKRADAINAARLHLAQNAYPGQNGLDFLTDARAILDHCGWLAFQRGYEHKRSTGARDGDAHRYGCDQMQCPRCWLTESERTAYDTAAESVAVAR